MNHWRILQGDVRERLADLPAGSARCCVTSPPYWGLRDYGAEGQLGLESTPEAYVAAMVDVFREVRRVLADDGTLWLNLGDSYAGGSTGSGGVGKTSVFRNPHAGGGGASPSKVEQGNGRRAGPVDGLKTKDLVGIPWMVAFALRADGWYLRSDIIWSKPNPMPESVTDRPTKAHEYIFLLSKSPRYYYDAEAIKEESITNDARKPYGSDGAWGMDGRNKWSTGAGQQTDRDASVRNKRSVWTVPTQPYPAAHFATFPEALIEPCILAGSQGAGKRCDCDEVIASPTGTGAIEDPSMLIGRAGFNRPRRVDEGTRPITRREQRAYAEQLRISPFRSAMEVAAGEAFAHYIRTDDSGARPAPDALLRQWLASGWLREPEPCLCPEMPADTVLDPFAGSGTTGAVAIRHQRNFIGTELNPEYIKLARRRIGSVAPMFAQEEIA